MTAALAVFRRELLGYFATPIAYVFIVIFLFAMGSFTFYLGGYYDAGQADLERFFVWHPWLYLLLVPALAMRLWAEESKGGTIELLLTLPLPVWGLVVGKFLAAWAVAGIALVLTFPMWITVNYLGEPDNGAIFAGYLGSFVLAGGYLAISAAISAATNNQVIAFVVSVVVCFLFTVTGLPLVLDVFSAWLPQALLETLASFSFLARFEAIKSGVIDIRDAIYFITLMVFWLGVNTALVDLKRA
jgi:ABC-2 type transport system permease protein